MDYCKHVTIYRTHIMSNGCYIGQFLKQIQTISFIPNSIWPNQLKHNTTTHRLTQQSWQNKTHAAQKRTAWTTKKKKQECSRACVLQASAESHGVQTGSMYQLEGGTGDSEGGSIYSATQHFHHIDQLSPHPESCASPILTSHENSPTGKYST